MINFYALSCITEEGNHYTSFSYPLFIVVRKELFLKLLHSIKSFKI